jgi:ferredoxin
MGADIYYFTGTGNSLAVARRLAGALGAPPPQPMVRLLDATEVATDAGTVGLVYPVHHWGPADLALRVARLLRPQDGAYVFAVATYGNHSGRAFQDLDRALRARGHGLDAGFHVRTVQNYVPVFQVPEAEVLRAILSGTDAQVDRIATVVKARGRGEREHWWWRPSVRTYYLSSKTGLHDKDRHFAVTDGCDSCGVCAQVCPAGNVVLDGGRPVWQHRCEQCFACINWCPMGAIEWGASTRGMGRYHHPDVTVEDMVDQRASGGR